MMTRLPDEAFSNPETYRDVVTAKEAKAVILHHQGRIFACGSSYDIVVSKPVVGTVTLTLKRTP